MEQQHLQAQQPSNVDRTSGHARSNNRHSSTELKYNLVEAEDGHQQLQHLQYSAQPFNGPAK